MANKNFCDICGKEIKDYVNNNRIRFSRFSLGLGYGSYHKEIDKILSEIPKDLDVCYICMGKIERKIKLLKEEEKIKQEEEKNGY